MKRSDILNCNFTDSIEYIPVDDPKFFQYIENLDYSGRYEENYKKEVIYEQVNNNRFNEGLVVYKINDIVYRTMFLEKYHNWILISRLISHNYGDLPILIARVLPELAKRYKKTDGIFASINSKNSLYLNCVSGKIKYRESYPLMKLHQKHLKEISIMNKTVLFNNVPQYIMYKELKGNINDIF